MTQEYMDKLKKSFDEEIEGFEMYMKMMHEVSEPHEMQILRDMAYDELCHAKHICMLVGDEGMEAKLHEAMGNHM